MTEISDKVLFFVFPKDGISKDAIIAEMRATYGIEPEQKQPKHLNFIRYESDSATCRKIMGEYSSKFPNLIELVAGNERRELPPHTIH